MRPRTIIFFLVGRPFAYYFLAELEEPTHAGDRSELCRPYVSIPACSCPATLEVISTGSYLEVCTTTNWLAVFALTSSLVLVLLLGFSLPCTSGSMAADPLGY